MDNQTEHHDIYSEPYPGPRHHRNNESNKELREFVRNEKVRCIDYKRFILNDRLVNQFQTFVESDRKTRKKREFTKSLYHIFGDAFRAYYGHSNMDEIGPAWNMFKTNGEPTYLQCKNLTVIKDTEDLILSYFNAISRENAKNVICAPTKREILDDTDTDTEVDEIVNRLKSTHISRSVTENIPARSTQPAVTIQTEHTSSNNMRRVAQNLVKRGNKRPKM